MTTKKNLNIRLTDPESIQRWREAAEQDGRSLSSWVRVQLDRAAHQQTPTPAGKQET